MAHVEVASAASEIRIELIQLSDYRFEARFDDPGIPVQLTDEVAPLGGNAGPSPVRLLAVAERAAGVPGRRARAGQDRHCAPFVMSATLTPPLTCSLFGD